jgi:TatD DNase family protein
MRFIDAHNHAQDERLASARDAVMQECAKAQVFLSAVNGATPSDWELVANLARKYSWVVPNFGVHPWYINDIPKDWQSLLIRYLDAFPSGVGETGIDGWKKEFDPKLQESIFIDQLQIAAERDLPISIHGLMRWGRLLEILRAHPLPACGFMLHSYGGPAEMIPAFEKLGGYFSFPGFFLSPGREMKLEVFRHVPSERLLIETDAPDQNLPSDLDLYKLTEEDHGKRINHPANISAVYAGLARFLGQDLESLANRVEQNFRSLFAPVLRKAAKAPASAG